MRLKTIFISIMALAMLFIGFTPAQASTFGDGRDGDLVINSGQTVYIDDWYNAKYGANTYLSTPDAIPQWNNVTIQSGGTLTVNNFSTTKNGSGRIVFKVKSQLENNGTINAQGKVNIGIPGYSNSVGRKGSGGKGNRVTVGSGGGGGGHRNNGSSGEDARYRYGKIGDEIWYTVQGGSGGSSNNNPYGFGSPGESGGSTLDLNGAYASGGSGGNGGGRIEISAKKIISSGRYDASGTRGGNGSEGKWAAYHAHGGGGGGGAGGTIILRAIDVIVGSTSFSGGGGGSSGTHTYADGGSEGNGGFGGNGSNGYGYLYYDNSYSGGSLTAIKTDLTPPTGKVNINNNSEKTHTHDVILYFTEVFDAYGVAKVKVSNYADFREYTSFNYPSTNELLWKLNTGPANSKRTVYVTFTDNNGNESDPVSASILVEGDTSPPVVNVKINNGQENTISNKVSLLINATDNVTAPSDMEMRISKDGGQTWAAWQPYTAFISEFDIGTIGGYRAIVVQVRDEFKNVGTGSAGIFYITDDYMPQSDDNNPATNATAGENLNGKIITINGINAEVLQSSSTILQITGLKNTDSVVISLDGVTWSPPDRVEGNTFSKPITFNREGLNAVYWKVKNKYGTESKIYTKYYLVDYTAAEVDVNTVSGAKATSGGSIQLAILAKDNISTVLYYSINGSAYQVLPSDGIVTASLSKSGLNNLSVKVIDQAGNVTSKVISIRKLAMTSPANYAGLFLFKGVVRNGYQSA